MGTGSLDGVDNDAARAIADAIPALVDQLLAVQPGRVRKEILRLVERAVFARVLAVTGGNQLRAARLLGMNRNTLHKHCRLLNLVAPRAEVGSEAGCPPQAAPVLLSPDSAVGCAEGPLTPPRRV